MLIFCVPIALLPRSVRFNCRFYFFVTSFVCRLSLWAAFLKIKIIGKEHLPHYPEQPSIIIMNHSSALDIPVVEMLAGSYPHVWMSKSAYRKVPFFGILLNRMHVAVERSSLTSARNALTKMFTLLDNRPAHGLLFPEGTRHDDGQIHKFYQGFAVLAHKLNRPVIPVLTIGLHAVMPKNSIIIDSNKPITIIVGKPIRCPEGSTVEAFTAQVHQYFQDTLKNNAH